MIVYLVYFITGILAGIIGGLLGTGGCALMMPVLRFGFHFDPAFGYWNDFDCSSFYCGIRRLSAHQNEKRR
jgi:hypothetical protein